MTTAPISPLAPLAAPSVVDAMALRMLDAVQAGQTAASAPSASPAPAPPATQPQTPLETALQTAAARQGGLAPLLADLTIAVQTPDMPATVLAAAARVLALQQPLEAAPSAGDLRQALAQSGLMLEARLAADGAPPEADLKAALLQLRQTLQAGTPSATQPGSPAPAPPYRGGPIQAQPPAASGLPAGASAEVVVQQLSRGADAALARQTLLQIASIPDAPQASGAQPVQWMFEIPFAAAQGAAIAQFEIGRDDEEDSAATRADGQPVWRARFSLDLAPMGPVHAKISLSGGRVRVALWAEDGATAAKLAGQRDALAQSLLGDDLVAQVSVFPGAPRSPAPSAGQFVDRAL